MAAKAKKGKKRDEGYQQKQNAVCIVLYDQTGETLSPEAQQEAEDAMMAVAFKHKVLMSITTT